MGANKVKEAVPVLSTHRCLNRLPGRLDRIGSGSMLFTAWSTPQQRPTVEKHSMKKASASSGIELLQNSSKGGCF